MEIVFKSEILDISTRQMGEFLMQYHVQAAADGMRMIQVGETQ